MTNNLQEYGDAMVDRLNVLPSGSIGKGLKFFTGTAPRILFLTVFLIGILTINTTKTSLEQVCLIYKASLQNFYKHIHTTKDALMNTEQYYLKEDLNG